MKGNERKITITIGAILLLLGVVWAAQGAGIAGGGSFMDNDPTFINLGGFVAVVGIALITLGAFWKTKAKTLPAK